MDSTTHNNTARMPSEVVPPTRSGTVPQQASTQPGDGAEVHDGSLNNDTTGQKPSFPERVIGVAQKTRGTILSKPELKAHGEKILDGQASAKDDKKAL